MPFFRGFRNLINDGGIGDVLAGTLTTTNSTATQICGYNLPTGSVANFEITIVGRRTDAGSVGDGATLTLKCTYRNVGGTLTQIGSDTAAVQAADTSINSSAASSATSGTIVQIKVAGVSNATINWQVLSGWVRISQ